MRANFLVSNGMNPVAHNGQGRLIQKIAAQLLMLLVTMTSPAVMPIIQLPYFLGGIIGSHNQPADGMSQKVFKRMITLLPVHTGIKELL